MTNNKVDYLRANLIDYAHDYIENQNAISDGTDKTYNLCVDYIYSGATFTDKQREKLISRLTPIICN